MNLDRSRESAYGLDRSRTAGWTINHSRIPVLVSPFWTFENLRYDTISETMRLVQMVGTLRDLASLNQSPFETWVICHGLETAYTMRSWLAPFSNRCWHVGTAALQCANEICHPNYEEIGCIPTPVRGRCPISVVNFRQSTLTFCWP